jgi:ABC-type phosphate transport system substrate-binding protein
VPVTNLDGLPAPAELKVSTATLLAQIFIGQIKNWNDPKIKKP